MFTIKIIFTIPWVIIRDGIHAHPQTQPWLIVPRTIVIQSRLLIEFLRIEKIRRIPNVIALLNEHFTERNILDMLHHLTVKVGDVTTATQVVWVIVELHLLVCIAFLEVVLRCSCHSTCLRSLQAAVIAAEALAIDIIVVVLAIVRHCKGNANREQYKMNSFIFIAEMCTH